jgi:hypothetical protein
MTKTRRLWLAASAILFAAVTIGGVLAQGAADGASCPKGDCAEPCPDPAPCGPCCPLC